MAVGLLVLVVLVGVVGMVGMFAAGFLMNRSKADRTGGER